MALHFLFLIKKEVKIMKKFTVYNKMHNTEYTFNVAEKNFSIINIGPELVCEVKLTDNQVKRANRKLCGMSDCHCGGINRAGEQINNNTWIFPFKK
jgi:hypothetical protein